MYVNKADKEKSTEDLETATIKKGDKLTLEFLAAEEGSFLKQVTQSPLLEDFYVWTKKY